jgi:hypothetical protein
MATKVMVERKIMTNLISDFVWDEVCKDAYETLDALQEDTNESYPNVIKILMEDYPEIKNEDMAYEIFWNWKKGKKKE